MQVGGGGKKNWSYIYKSTLFYILELQSIISCFIKIQIGLTFLVPAYPGLPGKEATKQVSVSCSGNRFNIHGHVAKQHDNDCLRKMHRL